MKMNPDVVKAIGAQVNRELYSSYLYLSMAGHCEEQNYPGFAAWLHAQAVEENAHGNRLIKFAADRGGRVALQAIAAPPTDFGSMVDVFEAVLEHEREVTSHIHELYELVLAKKDYSTQVELQWFINEQVEEEKTATDILEHLKRVATSPQGLFSIDRWLGQRQG